MRWTCRREACTTKRALCGHPLCQDAVGKLCNAYGGQRQNHPAALPIVEISSDSYKHKTYGNVHFPTFKIVQWDDEASLIAGKTEVAANDLDDSIPF